MDRQHLTTLPGGVRVATLEMPHALTVSMGIWAPVGGRHEPARLNGISHFIEHMLFKGTAKRSARRINEDIEGVGGDINAYTAEERTCYYATAAAEFFPRVCDVLCDIYKNPRFAPRDIDRERSVIAEEIQMYEDEPSSFAQDLLQAIHWSGHPLGRPITGTIDSIQGMDAAAFRAYRASHYHATNTVVTAAGRLTHGQVVDQVGRLLEGLPSAKPPRANPCPPPHEAPRLAVRDRDFQQTQLAIALPAYSHRDPRRFALHLLHVILGANASSRLFQEMREKRGLCYSVSSHWTSLDDGGALEIFAGLDRKNLERSLGIILSQCGALAANPPAAAELRRAKDYSIGASRMSMERPSNQSQRLGNSLFARHQLVDPEEVNNAIRAVTPDEIRDVARDLLRPDRLSVVVVGPKPDEKMLRRLLGLP